MYHETYSRKFSSSIYSSTHLEIIQIIVCQQRRNEPIEICPHKINFNCEWEWIKAKCKHPDKSNTRNVEERKQVADGYIHYSILIKLKNKQTHNLAKHYVRCDYFLKRKQGSTGHLWPGKETITKAPSRVLAIFMGLMLYHRFKHDKYVS